MRRVCLKTILVCLLVISGACSKSPLEPSSPDPAPIPSNPLPADPKTEPKPEPAPEPAPVPEPPPPPPPARPDRPHWYGRPMQLGWFFKVSNPLQGYRNGSACNPGTIDVLADSAAGIVATNDAPFGGLPSYKLVDAGRLTYIWAAANASGQFNEADFTTSRAYSRQHGVPMMLYYDGIDRHGMGSVVDRLEGVDAFALMGYPVRGDTLDGLIARLRSRLDDLRGVRSVAFVRAVDNRNGLFSEDFMDATQVPITALLRDYSNVFMELLFACARPNGALDFPRLLQHGNELADAARAGR